ncbi:MAG: hypothetical protein KBT45_05930 [Bacteroidales bacterium]|nr:hypothetical protein [Candidatus Colimorpha pelethequi]
MKSPLTPQGIDHRDRFTVNHLGGITSKKKRTLQDVFIENGRKQSSQPNCRTSDATIVVVSFPIAIEAWITTKSKGLFVGIKCIGYEIKVF